MKRAWITALVLGTVLVTQAERYEENWSSLRRHQTPEWLDGMKFGIYCHWGPQTVQLQEKLKGNEISRLEAIDQWKGEKFDAKAWVDLFEAAGAQFAGPVAWHGSGMVNWDSEVTEWNSVRKGPEIDIVGELTSELRRRDMKVIASIHFWRVWGEVGQDGSRSIDPETDVLHGKDNKRDAQIQDAWFDRAGELIDKYAPDLLWVDTGFGATVPSQLRGNSIAGRQLPGKENTLDGINEKIQQRIIAHYFNQADRQGKEVELLYKSHDVPPGIGMRDIENGSLIGLQYDPWIADINMAHHYVWQTPWFFNPVNPMKDADHLIDLLVDLTSKNGRMLLSVPPKADGTFSEDQVKQLTAMGDWLRINGEAIYNTIPWVFFGEGPTEETSPGHHQHGTWAGKDKNIPKWGREDIRFTQHGKNLYAIVLGWPVASEAEGPGGKLSIRTLGHAGKLYLGDIKTVELLGCDEPVKWEHTPEALVVTFPKQKPCDFAYVVKVVRW